MTGNVQDREVTVDNPARKSPRGNSKLGMKPKPLCKGGGSVVVDGDDVTLDDE